MTRTRLQSGDLRHTVLLGVGAGLIAAAATSLFEAAWGRARLPPTATQPPAPPPTEKLVATMGQAVTGEDTSAAVLRPAGALVHYAMGAALGLTYVLGRARYPAVGAGRGLVFGLAVWLGVEEAGLALVGLKPPPWRAGAGRRLFSISAHAVFGLALDAALIRLRRLAGTS